MPERRKKRSQKKKGELALNKIKLRKVKGRRGSMKDRRNRRPTPTSKKWKGKKRDRPEGGEGTFLRDLDGQEATNPKGKAAKRLCKMRSEVHPRKGGERNADANDVKKGNAEKNRQS